MTPSLPTPEDVDAAIGEASLGIDASELHGALAGLIAGGATADNGWIARVMADPTLAPETPGGAFERLRTATLAQYESPEFGLQLLLADDDAPLQVRSGSLFAWCRGFLGGFGLAAGDASQLSEDSSEALADLARLAAAAPQDDGDEEDEDALSELEEFVRVSAMLLYGDCVLAPRHRQQYH